MALAECSPSRIARSIPMHLAAHLTDRLGYTPPIPLESLAQDLDTRLVTQSLGRQGLMGYSWSTATGGHVVVINGDQPPAVRRFTLAHELMHRVLHAQRGTPPLDLRAATYDLTEMEANVGGAALLMPARWLGPLVTAWTDAQGYDRPWSPEAVAAWRAGAGPRWARTAAVSLTALGYRLADLGVVSSAGAGFWRDVSQRGGA